MAIYRRRGRPKIKKVEKDLGTKELRAKRALDITIEPLELCLKREIIDEEQYQAGIRLRWLYQLNFGSPNIRAYNMEYQEGKNTREMNEDWLANRFDEYKECLKSLEKSSAKKIVMNICIFGQRQSFLMPYKDENNKVYNREISIKMIKFKEGMNCLTKLFRITNKKKSNSY